MEREINNFVMVWMLVVASLCYCHTMSHVVPIGAKRLLAVLPVVCLFFLLPLCLTSISLGGLTSFFIAWLCNFKLLLLAFGQGPLSSDKSLSLTYFIAVACLPIKIQSTENVEDDGSSGIARKGLKSSLNYGIKCLLMISFLPVFMNADLVQPVVLNLIYCIQVYVSLELSLAMVGALARAFIGVGLEPQFEEPYLASSLQDFWGRRWNLMVTNILRPAIYLPMRSIFSRIIGRKWATLPASFSCFLVSALMHELIFYYIGRKEPTWVVTSFFLLHGACVALEIAIKKAFVGKFQLPKAISGAVAISFVLTTALWLFLPALLGCGMEEKSHKEAMAVVQFVKDTARVLRFSSITVVSG